MIYMQFLGENCAIEWRSTLNGPLILRNFKMSVWIGQSGQKGPH